MRFVGDCRIMSYLPASVRCCPPGKVCASSNGWSAEEPGPTTYPSRNLVPIGSGNNTHSYFTHLTINLAIGACTVWYCSWFLSFLCKPQTTCSDGRCFPGWGSIPSPKLFLSLEQNFAAFWLPRLSWCSSCTSGFSQQWRVQTYWDAFPVAFLLSPASGMTAYFLCAHVWRWWGFVQVRTMTPFGTCRHTNYTCDLEELRIWFEHWALEEVDFGPVVWIYRIRV